jgi:hypothetical protein
MSKCVLPSSRLRQSLSRRRPGGGGASARKAVFDLVGRNATPEGERNAGGFIHSKFDDGEEAVGLIVREKG